MSGWHDGHICNAGAKRVVLHENICNILSHSGLRIDLFSGDHLMSTISRAVTRNAVMDSSESERPMPRQTKPKFPDPDATLRSIREGTANASGEHFFRSLVQYLAVSLNVKSSFVAEFNAERSLSGSAISTSPTSSFISKGRPASRFCRGRSSTFPMMCSKPSPKTLC